MISPSVMCVDFENLTDELRIMEKCGIEFLHVDIMDGLFVPNYTLGVDFCRFLKRNTHIPLDYHLMIKDPEMKIEWFPITEGDWVSVHYEAGMHILRSLQIIRKMGGRPMVALNPGTPINVLEYLLDDIDGVLVMTVNPGFAGQKLVNCAEKKIREIREFLDSRGRNDIDIEVDGNVSLPNAKMMRAAGANIFVAGTSSIFRPDKKLEAHIQELRNVIL